MFEKDLLIDYLLDFYGDVLSDRVRAVMEAYYGEDLSLSEIAEGEGISRQGVRHLIKKGEEELRLLEKQLGLAARFTSLSRMADALEEKARACEGSEDPRVAELVAHARACAKQMRN